MTSAAVTSFTCGGRRCHRFQLPSVNVSLGSDRQRERENKMTEMHQIPAANSRRRLNGPFGFQLDRASRKQNAATEAGWSSRDQRPVKLLSAVTHLRPCAAGTATPRLVFVKRVHPPASTSTSTSETVCFVFSSSSSSLACVRLRIRTPKHMDRQLQLVSTDQLHASDFSTYCSNAPLVTHSLITRL